MNIKELNYDNIGVARAVIVGDSGNEYCTSVDAEFLRSWCCCPAYVLRGGKTCKHIIFLMNNIEFEKMNKKTDLNYIETECKVIDNMLGGGIPLGIVTAIFGEPTAGKTVFSKQVGLSSIAKTGKNTILIETEGLRDYDTKLLLYRFMSRYGLDKDTVDKKFIIKHTLGDMQLQSIQKLLQMFGYMVSFEVSKNGKYSIMIQNCVPTLTEKELKETSLIILDSLTKPVKDSVGSETQNLPARAQLIERLFGKLYHFAKIYDIGIIVIHHASVNPITPFGRDLGKPYGGDPILYNSKYALQFIDAPKRVKDETGFGEEARRIKLLRRPDEPYTGELVPVRLKKDWGFCDQ
jgi:RecA/RadA recombinase